MREEHISTVSKEKIELLKKVYKKDRLKVVEEINALLLQRENIDKRIEYLCNKADKMRNICKELDELNYECEPKLTNDELDAIAAFNNAVEWNWKSVNIVEGIDYRKEWNGNE